MQFRVNAERPWITTVEFAQQSCAIARGYYDGASFGIVGDEGGQAFLERCRPVVAAEVISQAEVDDCGHPHRACSLEDEANRHGDVSVVDGAIVLSVSLSR